MRTRRAVVLTLILTAAAGCHHDVDRTAELSATLRTIVTGRAPASVPAPVWTDVRTFYDRRRDSPAWVTDRSDSRALEALRILRTAQTHGFAPEDYGVPQMAEQLASFQQSRSARLNPDTAAIAELDVRLTAALLAFGRDVSMGRTTPDTLDPRWKAHRTLPDLAATLDQDADGDLTTWIEAVQPQHPEYAALQRALVDLQAQRDDGGWPAVPAGTYALDHSEPSALLLRKRLAAGGHLTGAAAQNLSPVFTAEDEAAVRGFQQLHGLNATGLADAATLKAMNVPLDKRIEQVAMNLERWRWMPDDFGQRHLLVNIPSYQLVAREDGKTVMEMRVVVGKPDGHETPVFSSEMSTVVFSPYWNIPDSIVEGETMPSVTRDPEYLAKNDIEILEATRSGATPIDYKDVNWDDARQVKRLTFRQRPGDGNALGNVKFLFPNPFDVYLHDTPADALFARPARALSHGCVRLEQPEALARYVLRDDTQWDGTRIPEAMHAGIEKHVRLRKTIPVHIVYFTASVDEGGALHLLPDVYRYDVAQSAHPHAFATP